MQIQVRCSKNCFKFALPQEAAASENNIEKEPQKPRPKLKKYVNYIFVDNIFSVCNSM